MKKLLLLGALPALFAMSEAKAAVISGITVDSYSSQYIAGADQRIAFYTTDGSGTTGNTAITNPSGSMWLTDGSPQSAFIAYNLGASYNLASVKFWNYNEAGNTARGIQTATVQVSSNGTTYTTLLPSITLNQAAGDSTSDITTLVGLSTTAQYVRFSNLANFTGGTDPFIGLSEIQFSSAAPVTTVPEPASMTLLGLGVAGLLGLRRRASRNAVVRA